MNLDFNKLTIREYLQQVENGKITLQEFLTWSEKRAQEMEELNIFIEKWYNEAKLKEKNAIPIAVKDLFLIKGKKISSASRMLKNFESPYTSTIIKRLEPFSSFIGRVNMDEFAMGASGKTSFYGKTYSPLKDSFGNKMCPGGSSSGSASAVAAGLCLAALGTDTGGSVRLPAAYTGIVGLKPTYGVFSRYGVIDFASSLDCPSLFTKTVDCCEFLFNKLIGEDENDFTSVNYEPQKSNKKVAIFIPENTNEEIQQCILKSKEILEKNGYSTYDISIDLLKYTIPIYSIIAFTEASSNLSRYDGIFYGDGKPKLLDDFYTKTRSDCFGDEVKRRICLGNFVSYMGNSDGYYNQGRKVLNKIAKNLFPILNDVDFILMPVSAGTAPTMKETENRNPIDLYREDLYTCFVNLLGIPGLSLPIQNSEKNNMPLAVQLVGRPFAENLIFQGAKILENETLYFLKKSRVDY